MKVVLFSLLMFVPLASGGTPGFPLELMEATDIRDIERLDYEVVRLNAKIKQCAAAGLAPAIECHCFYPNKLESAINVYQTVLKKHPEWENRAVLWWDSTRTRPSNLHLGGLKLTIEKPCQNLVSL
ncbi:MAG: hypothetical protein HOA25_15745 [Gammaproteobacteria bacterium]|nr:hypothetical protein [Gammaproteobacteria bacterium]